MGSILSSSLQSDRMPQIQDQDCLLFNKQFKSPLDLSLFSPSNDKSMILKYLNQIHVDIQVEFDQKSSRVFPVSIDSILITTKTNNRRWMLWFLERSGKVINQLQIRTFGKNFDTFIINQESVIVVHQKNEGIYEILNWNFITNQKYCFQQKLDRNQKLKFFYFHQTSILVICIEQYDHKVLKYNYKQHKYETNIKKSSILFKYYKILQTNLELLIQFQISIKRRQGESNIIKVNEHSMLCLISRPSNQPTQALLQMFSIKYQDSKIIKQKRSYTCSSTSFQKNRYILMEVLDIWQIEPSKFYLKYIFSKYPLTTFKSPGQIKTYLFTDTRQSQALKSFYHINTREYTAYFDGKFRDIKTKQQTQGQKVQKQQQDNFFNFYEEQEKLTKKPSTHSKAIYYISSHEPKIQCYEGPQYYQYSQDYYQLDTQDEDEIHRLERTYERIQQYSNIVWYDPYVLMRYKINKQTNSILTKFVRLSPCVHGLKIMIAYFVEEVIEQIDGGLVKMIVDLVQCGNESKI